MDTLPTTKKDLEAKLTERRSTLDANTARQTEVRQNLADLKSGKLSLEQYQKMEKLLKRKAELLEKQKENTASINAREVRINTLEKEKVHIDAELENTEILLNKKVEAKTKPAETVELIDDTKRVDATIEATTPVDTSKDTFVYTPPTDSTITKVETPPPPPVEPPKRETYLVKTKAPVKSKEKVSGKEFPIHEVREKIKKEIHQQEVIAGRALTPEEQRTISSSMLLKEQQAFRDSKMVGTIERLGKKSLDYWDNGIEKYKWGKEAKLALSTTLMVGSVIGGATLVGVNPPRGMASSVLGRLAVATGINTALTLNTKSGIGGFFSRIAGKMGIDKGKVSDFASSAKLNIGNIAGKISDTVGLKEGQKEWLKKNWLTGAGLGISMMMGGWAVGAVGLGGVVAKNQIKKYFEARTKEQAEKTASFEKARQESLEKIKEEEALGADFDIDKFVENENTYLREHSKITRAIERTKLVGRLANFGLATGVGVGTMATFDYGDTKDIEKPPTPPEIVPPPVAETPIDTPEVLVDVPLDTPEVLIDTPVDSPEVAVETPIDTPEVLIDTPVDSPEVAVETPIDTPEVVVDTPVDTPEVLIDTPVDTPEVAVDTPVDSPEVVINTPADTATGPEDAVDGDTQVEDGAEEEEPEVLTDPSEEKEETPEGEEKGPEPTLNHEIKINFEVSLGKDGVPANLETVFTAISADHMNLPEDGKITEEFAAKALNMGANMVQLSEGHNVAGIKAEDFESAATFENGVLKVIDHEKLNEIISNLKENADENWDKGILQGKGGAVSFIDDISKDRWVDEILHVKGGLHENADGELTGIEGHAEVTKDDVQDFGKSELVKNATIVEDQKIEGADAPPLSTQNDLTSIETGQLADETNPEGREVPSQEGKIPESTLIKDYANIPTWDTLKNTPVLDFVREATTGENSLTPAEMEVFKKIEEALNSNEITYNEIKDYPVEQVLNILDEIKLVPEVLKENINNIFENKDVVWWDEIKDSNRYVAVQFMELEEGTLPEDNLYEKFIVFMHKLRDVTGLEPKTATLGEEQDETNSEYITRALKEAAHIGKLDQFKL